MNKTVKRYIEKREKAIYMAESGQTRFKLDKLA